MSDKRFFWMLATIAFCALCAAAAWSDQARFKCAAEWLDDNLKDDDGRIYVPQFLRAKLEQPK